MSDLEKYLAVVDNPEYMKEFWEMKRLATECALVVEQFQKLLGVYTTTSAFEKIATLFAENERLHNESIELHEARSFHPRAMKLISKKKNFIVVAEDEPYFMAGYLEIRLHEKEKGTWTDEDEVNYQKANKRWLEKWSKP